MTLSLATLLFGSVLGGWAVLRCVGNERERQVSELDVRLTAELAAAEEAAIEAATASARLAGHAPLPRIPQIAKPTR